MSLEKCNSYKIYYVFDVFFFFLILLESKEKASSNENWCNRRPCSCVCKLHGRNAVQLLGETAGNCAYTLHIDAVQRTALASLMRQNTTLSSFLRFLFNVYPSNFPRKVSKSVTEFLAGQVLVLIFLRNNRSTCRKFAYDQVCYHFRRKIRTKHTFKSLIIYSIKSRN